MKDRYGMNGEENFNASLKYDLVISELGKVLEKFIEVLENN